MADFGLFLFRFASSIFALFLITALTYLSILAPISRRARNLFLVIIWLPALVLPLIIPYDYRLARLFLVLISGFLVVRSLDFLPPSTLFDGRPGFWRFFFYVYLALALDYPRPGGQYPPRDFGGLFQILRGFAITAIALIIMLGNTCLHTPETAFWLNIASKMFEWYLLFVGFMDFYYGIGRIIRIPGKANLREPLLARSPADFWFNRWNLPVIDYIQRYIFIPAGALNHPYRATLFTFLASGVIHEYGFDLAAQKLTGLVLSFFLIQGITIIIIRAIKRPLRKKLPRLYRSWRCHPLTQFFQWALTSAFLIITGSLFFRAVDLVIDFHRIGFMMQICDGIRHIF